ncbi:conserved hypothetical protein [delta proteobacterium NaphS2]|nr:conserved hypothetical protein [delta proteobacterium NaphS2]
MKQLTIRRVSPELDKALVAESRLRGESVNQTVLDLLKQALGLHREGVDNGLGKFAGTWTEEEFFEFEKETAFFETIDPELWKQ